MQHQVEVTKIILTRASKNDVVDLFQVQIVGATKALPLLRHQQGVASGASPFLLNPQVSLALYLLSTLLVLASSLVLYLYGHTR